MDLTLYIFDDSQQLRRIVTENIAQCVHSERARTLSAELPTAYAVRPGEFLGLTCVDGRFRLFCVEYADEDDETATTAITAKDAAADDLACMIVEFGDLENVTGTYITEQALIDTGFEIGVNEANERKMSLKGGAMTVWEALEEAETALNLYMSPYYTFDGAKITGGRVDILAKRGVYRGRFVQEGIDGSGIAITRSGRPRPVIYPIGADNLSISGVEWSVEAGDPVDKPLGQAFIAVPEAAERYAGRAQIYTRQDINKAEELAKAAWEYAQKAAQPEVTASATISDMEMIAGQTWKSVRLWDIVRVRPRFGGDVEEQVIEIKRDYVRHDETQITLGKEPDSSAKRMKNLSKGLSANNRATMEVKTELRDSLVKVEEMDEYVRTEISDVRIKLSAAEAAILLRATREELLETEEYWSRELSEASIRIDAAEAEITLKASIEQAEALESEISAAIIRLDGAESRIDLKADRTYVERLIAEEIEAAKADIETAWAELVVTDTIYVTGDAYVTNLVQASALSISRPSFRLGGETVSKTQLTVVTGISGGAATTESVELLTTSVGEERTITVGSATPATAGGKPVTNAQGEEITEQLYTAGEDKTYTERGELVTVGLYEAGPVATLVGETFNGQLYGRGEMAYVCGDEVALTRVKLQGTRYAGKLYDADGVLVNGSADMYLGDGNYVYRVPSGVTQVYKRGAYTRMAGEDFYEPGTFCFVGGKAILLGEEYTAPLYTAGKNVTVTGVGEPVEYKVFKEGVKYGGGLYTDFVPGRVKLRDVTALAT